MCRVTIMVAFFLSNCPSIVFLCLFCIIYILVHAITNSEFSQDDVLGTRISVPPS